MEEWKEYKLGEIGEIIGGGTPSTKDVDNYNYGTIPWLTPKDLSTFTERYISRGERNITDKGLKTSSAKLMPKNSILFSSRAPIGYIAIAENEICTNQGFKSIIPNEKVNYLFLYYLLKFNKEKIENLGSGTTFKEVSGSTMKQVSVKIPTSINEQVNIASILSSLDDKIELNNKINNNLEQQAQAIFKNWFKEEIENIESKKQLLGELVEIIDNRGKTPPSKTEKTPYPIIDVAALRNDGRIIDYENCTKYISEDTYNTFFRAGHPKLNDILLSTVGSLGQMKFFMGNKGCIAQNVVALRIKISPYYMYEYLKYIKQDLLAYDIGSVQPSIKITHIIKHPIYVPETQYLEKFDQIARPITEQIYNLSCENENLKKLRDTLLPKLMSGEIDVSKLEI